ncbi:hypothetical protein MM236_18705 [Belliella sp. DSM 107340]|uniref:AlgX/AlgJ SGNH hydrolase-like domain-containing protein n=1 Tax=Belliella calami TaxID=2923436 RepID=A0ABS9UTS8_9BACT|nr:hypothetical protein [Belliella calami]MCH7400032.1 hypothetical protein [Belliella calami]
MKKFILKSSFFIIPFLVLFGIRILHNGPSRVDGDLVRMAYFYSNPLPMSTIKDRYDMPIMYSLLTETNPFAHREFEVMTIGDSFSEQDNLGYKNFLGNAGVSVLHVDRHISGSNPIQTLVSMMNSDFFEVVKPKYVVLQSIEREINQRTRNVDFNEKLENINFYIPEDSDSSVNSNNEVNAQDSYYSLQFFSDATIKMPLNYLQYLFMDKPITSNTYKVKTTTQSLFSNSPNNLLFYKRDFRNLAIKNDSLSIVNSVNVLNKVSELLSNKNIELIVLISPDKYDLYYPYIKDKSKYKEPTFFSTYQNAEKFYKNIDIYGVFSSKLPDERDIYYYDDSHWAPKGAKIIADEIFEMIK